MYTNLHSTLVDGVDGVDGAAIVYLQLLFVMVCNLSTTYRSFVMLTSVIRATVNKSLLDMDTKFTTLSNIIYSLILLLIIDQSSSASGGAAGLASSLCLQVTKYSKTQYDRLGECVLTFAQLPADFPHLLQARAGQDHAPEYRAASPRSQRKQVDTIYCPLIQQSVTS